MWNKSPPTNRVCFCTNSKIIKFYPVFKFWVDQDRQFRSPRVGLKLVRSQLCSAKYLLQLNDLSYRSFYYCKRFKIGSTLSLKSLYHNHQFTFSDDHIFNLFFISENYWIIPSGRNKKSQVFLVKYACSVFQEFLSNNQFLSINKIYHYYNMLISHPFGSPRTLQTFRLLHRNALFIRISFILLQSP